LPPPFAAPLIVAESPTSIAEPIAWFSSSSPFPVAVPHWEKESPTIRSSPPAPLTMSFDPPVAAPQPVTALSPMSVSLSDFPSTSSGLAPRARPRRGCRR
jgi:hypothetical protein